MQHTTLTGFAGRLKLTYEECLGFWQLALTVDPDSEPYNARCAWPTQ